MMMLDEKGVYMPRIDYYKALVVFITVIFFTIPYNSFGFRMIEPFEKKTDEQKTIQNCAENGKIVITIPRNCLSGTLVRVLNSSNEEVMILSPSKEGQFQTPCSLVCGEEYYVIPIHPTCKFSPASLKVIAKCCPEYGVATFEGCSCNDTKGKILISLPSTCIKNTTIKVSKPDGSNLRIITPNAKGIFDTGCILECDADYLVQPINDRCSFTPESLVTKAICCSETTITPVTFDCSCAPEMTGKIVVRFPSNCIQGTSVVVTDKGGRLITTLSTPNRAGYFETSCILICGENYTVTPINASCQFSPSSATVVAKCCPEYGQVSFQCECEPNETGKIAVKIPSDCLDGTTIKITTLEGAYITTLTSYNSNGLFETNCQLLCGQSYIATPANDQCSFTPSKVTITAKCCPEYGLATFQCSCQEQDNGKIRIKIPTSCLEGTSIRISKADGSYVTTLTNASDSGFFETQCNLVCGQTYDATPQNENCIFIPSSATVTAKCCPGYGEVEFQCSCNNDDENTGKIIVKVATQCIYGTTITITKLDGTYVMTLKNGTSSGVFESSCTLKCGETYRVTPSNDRYSFTPSYTDVIAKCCPEYGYATFSCCSCPPEDKGKIIIRFPYECVRGTKLTLTELSGEHVLTLTSGSSDGVFDTGCTLVCDRTYRVVPSNEHYNFSPPYADVTAKCCPDYGSVYFSCCECPAKDTGKIVIKIPLESMKNTRAVLVDSKGKSITLSSGNLTTGTFESACSLVCDEKYTVYLWNPEYYFSPFSQEVTAQCCPEYGYVSFKSTKKISMMKCPMVKSMETSYERSRLNLYLWTKKFEIIL